MLVRASAANSSNQDLHNTINILQVHTIVFSPTAVVSLAPWESTISVLVLRTGLWSISTPLVHAWLQGATAQLELC